GGVLRSPRPGRGGDGARLGGGRLRTRRQQRLALPRYGGQERRAAARHVHLHRRPPRERG
ncbi:unnamed protein product, partial [Prorocentrum cordatum]